MQANIWDSQRFDTCCIRLVRLNKFEASAPDERLNAVVNSALCVSSRIFKRSINVSPICGMQTDQTGTSSQLQIPFINQLASHCPRSEERRTGTMGANASPPPAAKCASQNAYSLNFCRRVHIYIYTFIYIYTYVYIVYIMLTLY